MEENGGYSGCMPIAVSDIICIYSVIKVGILSQSEIYSRLFFFSWVYFLAMRGEEMNLGLIDEYV